MTSWAALPHKKDVAYWRESRSPSSVVTPGHRSNLRSQSNNGQLVPDPSRSRSLPLHAVCPIPFSSPVISHSSRGCVHFPSYCYLLLAHFHSHVPIMIMPFATCQHRPRNVEKIVHHRVLSNRVSGSIPHRLFPAVNCFQGASLPARVGVLWSRPASRNGPPDRFGHRLIVNNTMALRSYCFTSPAHLPAYPTGAAEAHAGGGHLTGMETAPGRRPAWSGARRYQSADGVGGEASLRGAWRINTGVCTRSSPLTRRYRLKHGRA